MKLDSATDERLESREVLTVTELNRAVAQLLDRSVPPLRVTGEISNLTRAASGHWYFTLKDSAAQVRAVMFRGRAQAVGFQPADGDRVEVRALASFYQARGEFQLTVESMRRAGAGDLFQRFLQLKERLRAEGLLEASRKRTLPRFPRCVGVVTSPQGAALRDVLTTLRRRAPHVPVVIYPTLVQGQEAPAAIVAALRTAARRAECDVLLVVRGGGSIEDLWAFNDESVARMIATMPVPVVSGVGHETDFTIVDFVADARAATPTAAAALVVVDHADLVRSVDALAARLASLYTGARLVREQRLDTAMRLLRSPVAYVAARALALDGLARRGQAAMRAGLHGPGVRLAQVWARVRPPDTAPARRALDGLETRLARSQGLALARRRDRVDALAHKLELVSPAEVLRRGYAIVRRADGTVVRSAGQVAIDERLDVRLGEGSIDVAVVGNAASQTTLSGGGT